MLFDNLDTYTLQARVSPVLIVAFPLVLWLAGLFGEDATGWGVFTALLAFSGLGPLVGQLGRDRGLRVEKELVRQWGGMPTTRFLRHEGGHFSPETLADIHSNIQRLLPDTKEVTPAEERADPAAADRIYGHWVSCLRELTRDSTAFPLVHAENINYGFRRNLLGLRGLGLYAALWPLVLAILDILSSLFGNSPGSAAWTPMDKVTLFTSALLLVIYSIIVTPDWVKTVAEAYAERLLLASEKLAKP